MVWWTGEPIGSSNGCRDWPIQFTITCTYITKSSLGPWQIGFLTHHPSQTLKFGNTHLEHSFFYSWQSLYDATFEMGWVLIICLCSDYEITIDRRFCSPDMARLELLCYLLPKLTNRNFHTTVFGSTKGINISKTLIVFVAAFTQTVFQGSETIFPLFM